MANRDLLILSADFPVTGTGATNVSDLTFTPAANTRYRIEGAFMWRADALARGCSIGISVPTGLVDVVGQFYGGQQNVLAFNVVTWRHFGGTPSSGVPLSFTANGSTSDSWPAFLRLTFETGATPVGDCAINFRGSAVGSTATLRKWSFLAVYSGYTNQ